MSRLVFGPGQEVAAFVPPAPTPDPSSPPPPAPLPDLEIILTGTTRPDGTTAKVLIGVPPFAPGSVNCPVVVYAVFAKTQPDIPGGETPEAYKSRPDAAVATCIVDPANGAGQAFSLDLVGLNPDAWYCQTIKEYAV